MRSRKKDEKEPPKLPVGEHYSQYDIPRDSDLRGIKCTTCSRWLSTDEAVKKHIGMGCRIIDFKSGEPYDPT